jgi:hypothetical protein
MYSFRPWLIRLAGITALSLLTFFIFFNFVGKTDVTWALPWKQPFRLAWPELPHFASWKTTAPDGQAETIYQVPARQLTKAEIAQMSYTPGATNAATASTAPASSAR